MQREMLEQELSEMRAELQSAIWGERADRSKVPFALLDARVRNTVELMETVRLGVKYVAFDLDATRRENEALRARLQLTDQDC